MANEGAFLPIRIIQPSRDFLVREKKRAIPKATIFDEDTYDTHKIELINQVDSIKKEFSEGFKQYPESPRVMKAKMKEKALAKSWRPRDLLNVDTCPMIGVSSLGVLLLSATNEGIRKLEIALNNDEPIKLKSNISSIEKFESFDLQDKLRGLNPLQLKELSRRGSKQYLKVIMFDHGEEIINHQSEYSFFRLIRSLDLEVKEVTTLTHLKIFQLSGVVDENIIRVIGNHPAVRRLSFFPRFKIIRPTFFATAPGVIKFPTPVEGLKYPLVGILDSGIPDKHPALAPWVATRKSFVPAQYSNCNHGSFVGALACAGYILNGGDICPDEGAMALVDVQIIPNDDQNYGDTDYVCENDIMQRLEESIPDLTREHNLRVLNMSFGPDEVCDKDKFSDFGMFLDRLQDQHNIIFTIPIGNYEEVPQREWPPQQDFGISDRMTVPADSVRAISVGAIACAERPDSIVRKDEPTSYSRRGPGPAFITKPELVHYSGNLSALKDGNLDSSGQGIKSLDEKGNPVEDLGTSYSSPLVARALSLIAFNVVPEPSNNLVKALLIHNSETPKTLDQTDKLYPYVGFGLPRKVEEVFGCKEHSITLIFEQEIYEGHALEVPFPWPPSLRDERGRCKGDIKMTLVAQPPLDENCGSEYIRAKLTAALHAAKGINKKGTPNWKAVVDLEPGRRTLKSLYESERIKHGFKWCPIKRYSGRVSRVQATDWRIQVRLLLRDAITLGPRPVRFALIVTISDPLGKAPVYNEVVTRLHQMNILTNEIQIRSQVRERVQPKV